MDTLAAHKSNGQRLVIRRAITGFEATQFAHCGLSSLNQIADQSRRPVRPVSIWIVSDDLGSDAEPTAGQVGYSTKYGSWQ